MVKYIPGRFFIYPIGPINYGPPYCNHRHNNNHNNDNKHN